MQIHPESNGIVLEFFPAEAHFLSEILDRIARAYEESNPGIRRGPDLGESGYAEDDIEAWKLENLEAGQGHARMARKWQKILREGNRDWVRWEMAPQDIEQFLILANDHRMYLARHHEITEDDMGFEPDELLQDERRMVLLEIHLLAQLMELLLPYAPL